MSTEETTPQQRAAATKRQRTNLWIRDAARTLFDEHGYHGVTRDDIVVASGMGLTTISKHFPTKRALAVATYAPEVLALMASAEKELVDKVSPEAVFTSFIHELATYLVAHPAMAYVLLPLSQDARTPDDESILVVSFRDLVEHLAKLAGLTEDDADFALGGLLTWIVQHPGRSSEDAANVMLSLLL